MKTSLHLLISMALVSILVYACAPATATLVSPTITPAEVTSLPGTQRPEITLPFLTTWKASDIEAATTPEKCRPVATLPKTLRKEWMLGFINPNRTHPFFLQRDAGMAAAAVFYGVKYIGLDAKDGSSFNLLPSLLAQQPDLIGSHNDVYNIAAKAQSENIPFVSVDLMPSKYALHPYGVPDVTAGKLGGELLVQGLRKRMAGEWNGKELFFLGFTSKSIPACVTRIDAVTQTVKDSLGLDDTHILTQDPYGENTTPEKALLSVITAHPQAVFGLIPCWDQLGIDPYKAATAAGYENNILMVTLGGDKSNLGFLKTKPTGYYGLVEFQPYCEGWSWVETAVAILEGVYFEPYIVSRTDTQANVDVRYAELYGDGGK